MGGEIVGLDPSIAVAAQLAAPYIDADELRACLAAIEAGALESIRRNTPDGDN